MSCGWLPFWGSPAGSSFPNGTPSGKRSSSSCVLMVVGASSGCGGGLLLPGLRVSGSGCRLLPDPFRRFSVPPLAGLEGQGCGDWVVRLLRLGYCLPFLGTPHVPLFPSQCLIPAPSPSQGLLWGNSPWSWLPRLLWSLLHSLLHPRGCSGEYLLGLGCQGCSGACSTPFSRLLQPFVRSVVDLGVMAFGHHPLPSPSLCGRVTLSVGVHSVCAPVSKSGGLAGLLRSQGSVHSSAGSSCFSSLSSLLVT